MTTYDDLGAPWQQAVDQAWESFVADSLGIGAVVTDRSGEVVSAGRNRITEATGPVGHLFGSRLAHAELDALAGLGTDKTEELVLWTTLEPCLLCAGAIVLCDIRDVRYAASDPLWFGAERLSDLNDFLSAYWPERTGPVDGPLATFRGAPAAAVVPPKPQRGSRRRADVRARRPAPARPRPRARAYG